MIHRVALKAVSQNKLRAGLTMPGMIIGVGAVRGSATVPVAGDGTEHGVHRHNRCVDGLRRDSLGTLPGEADGPARLHRRHCVMSDLTWVWREFAAISETTAA